MNENGPESKNPDTPETSVDQPEAYDEQWYEEAKQLMSFQTYQFFVSQNRVKQRNEYLESGKSENPTLDYPELKLDDLILKENALLAFKNKVKQGEHNETVRQAYIWKINEKIAEIRMLKAAASKDMHRFERYNSFIYGSPSKEIFTDTICAIHDDIDTASGSDNVDLIRASHELSAVIPETGNERQRIKRPDQHTFKEVQDKTMHDLEPLLSLVEKIDTFPAEKIKETFEKVLKEIEASEWKVEFQDGTGGRMNINPRTTRINLTVDKKVVYGRMRELVLHEIGTHIMNREKGGRSKLKLLGLGLDRYEKGNEGVATLREQTLQDTFGDYAKLDRHLAISLAKGMDGIPRDFNELNTIMVKYYTFQHLKNGKNLEEAKKNAETDAWQVCVDTFRGTDCRTKGVCYMKDMVYREGNIGVWNAVSENNKALLTFSVGVLDPSNPRHLLILTKLGITDNDLAILEK